MSDLLEIRDKRGRVHYAAPEHIVDIMQETDGSGFVYLAGGFTIELTDAVTAETLTGFTNVLRRLAK